MRVVVVRLGEIRQDQALEAVTRHFGQVETVHVDRRDVWALARARGAAAALVAPDLQGGRLRLTSMLLAFARPRERWRIDLHGRTERWSLGAHLARNAWPLARHLVACGIAAAIGQPILRVMAALIKERRVDLARPERILYLRSQLWLGLAGGGSVAHTAGVIGGLQQCGVDVRVVSSDALLGVTAPTTIVRPEVWFDGWLRELEDLAYNVPFFIKGVKDARKFGADAIYQRHTAFNVVGAAVSRLLRLPLVLEFNSSEVWKGRYWGGLRLRRAAELVERINLKAADRIVVVSRVLRDELIAAGVPESKIVLNPNAVDARTFAPEVSDAEVRRELGFCRSEVVIGFSGTFGAWHGIPTLAKALWKVVSASDRAAWLLIGDGPLRGLVEAEVRRHGLEDRVRRVGLVPHDRMPPYLAACDILVAPHGRQADGREFFGSPTKLYEYMAMGRPVVASRVGQIGDVLVDEASALLVPPDDADALAAAITRLIDDACLRRRLGNAARIAAENEHTWRQNAERVLGAFQAW